MEHYEQCVIKSFKHNGHIHRLWEQNWLVPEWRLADAQREESAMVVINRQTPIQEASGKQWVSRVPAVSFFLPGQWFNVVALIEEDGVRYYCNIASPPYRQEGVITYIDYDLDVIRTIDESRYVVDQDEYERHKSLYHYPQLVQNKVQEGLYTVLDRIDHNKSPFHDDTVMAYYRSWCAYYGDLQ